MYKVKFCFLEYSVYMKNNIYFNNFTLLPYYKKSMHLTNNICIDKDHNARVVFCRIEEKDFINKTCLGQPVHEMGQRRRP